MRAQGVAAWRIAHPDYFNREGMKLKAKEQKIAARAAVWGEGVSSFVKVINDWRQEGSLKDTEDGPWNAMEATISGS
ncbi:uncharacterized protein N7482_005054 [Penicillium canariense]|uniref:Uncharacterized protein n=1 Tax=Penicillium canariense TaxID=189055 RepID=A0A9W9I429_9EURO|nr:uncharacterized protein N7482_005054 [Penicillium canariense]KAJ5166273.1 hypothetical protein N7482_005054 [Penicillium canariense]